MDIKAHLKATGILLAIIGTITFTFLYPKYLLAVAGVIAAIGTVIILGVLYYLLYSEMKDKK